MDKYLADFYLVIAFEETNIPSFSTQLFFTLSAPQPLWRRLRNVLSHRHPSALVLSACTARADFLFPVSTRFY